MSIKCTITCHMRIHIILNYLVYNRLLVSIKYGLSYEYEFVEGKKKGYFDSKEFDPQIMILH
jgi:hypothetical protein